MITEETLKPVAWDETAPSREYVDMLKGEIEAQRARLSDAKERIRELTEWKDMWKGIAGKHEARAEAAEARNAELEKRLADARNKALAVVDFAATMTTEARDGRGTVTIRFDALKDAHGFVDALAACRAMKEKAND